MAFGRGRFFRKKFEASGSDTETDNSWDDLEEKPAVVEENESEASEEELDYSDIGEAISPAA